MARHAQGKSSKDKQSSDSYAMLGIIVLRHKIMKNSIKILLMNKYLVPKNLALGLAEKP
jgi:hypothetical protein